MTYRSWGVIEPDPRSPDPARGARGMVADPAFMLARQWQFGEFDGYDGGAPIRAFVKYHHHVVDRFDADDLPAGSVDQRSGAALYAEPYWVRHAPGRPDAEMQGLRLGRELDAIARGAGSDAATKWDAVRPVLSVRNVTTPMGRLAAQAQRPATDGAIAVAALREGGLLDPLTEPGLSLHAFARAWRPDDGNAGTADPFDPVRLTNRVRLFANDTHVDLEASDARPGWWQIAALNMPDPMAPNPEQQGVIPTRASFAGSPPDRHWSIVDAATDWTAADAGPTDLPRMIVATALLQVSGRTVVLPLTVPRGGLTHVAQIRMKDAFERLSDHTAGSGTPRLWRAEGLEAVIVDLTHRATLDADHIERVALVPEDTTGVTWMIERMVPGPLGQGQLVSETVAAVEPPTPGSPPRLDLRRPPPANWTPMVPEDAVTLRARPLSWGDVPTEHRGILAPRLLELSRPALPAAGIELRRRWCLDRDTNGRLRAWIERPHGHHSETRSSGLVFDALVLSSDR